jgi:hypothetical protein
LKRSKLIEDYHPAVYRSMIHKLEEDNRTYLPLADDVIEEYRSGVADPRNVLTHGELITETMAT